MTNTSQIFDRELYCLRKSRNASILHKADFLIKHSLEDIEERLNLMERNFENVLNLGCRTGYGSIFLNNRKGTISLTEAEVCKELLDRCFTNNRILINDEVLTFKDNSFDLIISILNLHNINDLPGYLIQLKNSLKPHGVLIASLFGENNLFQLREILEHTEIELLSGISPRMKPSIAIKQLGSLLQRAGFTMQIVDKESIPVNYSNPLSLLRDIKIMSENNILLNRNKKFVGKKFWKEFSKNYKNKYSTADNSVIANFEILTLTAVK